MIAEYEANTTATSVQTKYLTQDHLGSPRVITNQSGAVVSRHDYRAFGEEIYSGTANRTNAQGYGQADGIRKQYTGYERDYESGLDFAQARYYNSQHGRFTSVDPLTSSANVKNPQTFNRYSYVLNSPYKFTDPLGLLPVSSAACGLACPNRDKKSVDGSGFSSRYVIPGTENWGKQDNSDAVGDFVKTGETTFEYRRVDIPLKDEKAEIGGKRAFVLIYWEANKGYVLAADGKTKLKAFEATSEIKFKIVDANRKEFTKEEHAPKVAHYENIVKGIAKKQNLDNRANCHGTTFAGGRVWINNDEINGGTMKAMGYRKLGDSETVSTNDVGLYKSGGKYVHSVKFNSDTKRVRGKGGIEPYRGSAAPGPGNPGDGKAWDRPSKLQIWTTRPKPPKKKKGR